MRDKIGEFFKWVRSSVVERFPDKKEVHSSILCAPTSNETFCTTKMDIGEQSCFGRRTRAHTQTFHSHS